MFLLHLVLVPGTSYIYLLICSDVLVLICLFFCFGGLVCFGRFDSLDSFICMLVSDHLPFLFLEMELVRLSPSPYRLYFIVLRLLVCVCFFLFFLTAFRDAVPTLAMPTLAHGRPKKPNKKPDVALRNLFWNKIPDTKVCGACMYTWYVHMRYSSTCVWYQVPGTSM